MSSSLACIDCGYLILALESSWKNSFEFEVSYVLNFKWSYSYLGGVWATVDSFAKDFKPFDSYD